MGVEHLVPWSLSAAETTLRLRSGYYYEQDYEIFSGIYFIRRLKPSAIDFYLQLQWIDHAANDFSIFVQTLHRNVSTITFSTTIAETLQCNVCTAKKPTFVERSRNEQCSPPLSEAEGKGVSATPPPIYPFFAQLWRSAAAKAHGAPLFSMLPNIPAHSLGTLLSSIML